MVVRRGGNDAPAAFREAPIERLLQLIIRLYRGLARSGLLAGLGFAAAGCRYYPSCSAYAEEAITRHGWAAGLRLSVRRLLRCRPGAGAGWDPVPYVTQIGEKS